MAAELQTTSVSKQRWQAVAWRLCTKYGFPLVLLVAVCALAMWYGWYSRRQGPANAGLTVDPVHLDFGSAWQGSRVAMKLPIKNPTAQPVEVSNLQLSCGCTLVKPHTFTVEPGETRQLDVEINLDAWPKEDWNLDKRRFQGAIIPQLASTRAQQRGWIINGVVARLLKVSLPVPSFPNNLVVGQPFSPLTVTATYAVPLDKLTAECDPPKGTVTVQGGPEVFQVQIAPKADLPIGPVQFEVTLQPHRWGEQLPAAKLPQHAVIHDVVEASPPQVIFGALAVGSTGKRTIVLSSRTGSAFTVESWQGGNGSTNVEPLKGVENDAKIQRTFQVTQIIADLGRQESKVTFVVRLSDSRKLEVPCVISYHGLTPGTNRR